MWVNASAGRNLKASVFKHCERLTLKAEDAQESAILADLSAAIQRRGIDGVMEAINGSQESAAPVPPCDGRPS